MKAGRIEYDLDRKHQCPSHCRGQILRPCLSQGKHLLSDPPSLTQNSAIPEQQQWRELEGVKTY